jgi:beta-aspartyl-peptidase (threonine type)
VTEEKLTRHRSIKENWSKGETCTWLRRLGRLTERFPKIVGTVGAVAVDGEGNAAAGVSTGGCWLKLEGRGADSAVVGAGLYTDNTSGASCATGVGEAIMKVALSKEVCNGIRGGLGVQESCDKAIEMISTKLGGQNAGIIAVDRKGRLGAAFNTSGMGRGYMRVDLSEPAVAVGPEERFVESDS